MTRPTLPRTPDRFALWLRTRHAPHDVVGARGCTDHCPLAQYLRAEGADHPCVYVSLYFDAVREGMPIPTTASRPTPPWARTFLETLDTQNTHMPTVTAEEALAILAGLIPTAKKERSHDTQNTRNVTPDTRRL
jgi:hypothetical protein